MIDLNKIEAAAMLSSSMVFAIPGEGDEDRYYSEGESAWLAFVSVVTPEIVKEMCALIRNQESELKAAQAAPVSAMQDNPHAATFPAEIWLNVGDGGPHEVGPHKDLSELSWCWESIDRYDVRYVRADLAAAHPLPAEQVSAPQGTVDSIESKFGQFWSYMNAWGNAIPGDDADKKANELVKYIDAHTAQAVAAKQAEIDRLMLEFCPGEMSAEQMAAWEASQREATAHLPRTTQTVTRYKIAATQQHAQAEDAEESSHVIMRQGQLLAGVAIALNGEENARGHSNHDLPELAAKMALELEVYRQQHAQAAQDDDKQNTRYAVLAEQEQPFSSEDRQRLYSDALAKLRADDRSRVGGNDAQAALSEQLKELSKQAEEARQAAANPNLERIHLGMRDAYDIASGLAARQPAPVMDASTAAEFRIDQGHAAPVAAAAQGEAARTMQSLIEDAVANHKSPTGYVKLCMAHFEKYSAEYQQGRASGIELAAKLVEPATDMHDDELTEYGKAKRKLAADIRALTNQGG